MLDPHKRGTVHTDIATTTGMGWTMNRLIMMLPPECQERLRPLLTPVTLEYRKPLYEAGERIENVFFLYEGVASLVSTMMNGDAAEVGTIGNEGFVGYPVLMGDTTAGPTNVYIQVPGSGVYMPAATFRREVDDNATFRHVLLRYGHAFFNQVAQSAACAHLHKLDERCCRWLLMTRDRMESDEFLLTQEFLSMMLGVRRAGVSQAANILQRDGLIEYHRGHVTILDRHGLEDRACECYHLSKAEFDSLLGKNVSPTA